MVQHVEALECRTVLDASGVGTFNPANFAWALRSTASAGEADAGTFQFGSGGVPVVGDWNGDGRDDIGLYNRSTMTWSLRYSTTPGEPDVVFKFGKIGADPIVGDWNGDGVDDFGMFRRSTRTWYLHFGTTDGGANSAFNFGKSGVAVVGDWNGDGRDGIGVFDKYTNTWYLRQTATPGQVQARFRFGSSGNEDPLVGDWDGDGIDGIGYFQRETATWSLRQTATAGTPDVGTFQFGDPGTLALVGNFKPQTNGADENELLTLTLKPLDLDLLGLRVQSSEITVTVTTEQGDGKLLGNLLNSVSDLINEDEINDALNNVLGTTVDLLNSVGLQVEGVGAGAFSSAPVSTTPILELMVAPVHLDLLGAQVDTSPITLSISATSGEGLVLGNVLTALADVFNPPLPEQLDLNLINSRLTQLLADLDAQIPGIAPATVPTPVLQEDQILNLTVPALNLDLMGLVLQTTPITVDANAQTGDGLLLGNILGLALDTVNATPEQTRDLNANVNNLLAKIIGVLNASTITLPSGALDELSSALQSLALPNLITTATEASAPVLDLVIASTDGTTPPVSVDLLGVHVETSDIDAHLSAHTGEGKVLGNLVYNVANLLNPGGPASLISLITDLATGSNTATAITPSLVGTLASPPTHLLTVTLPPLDLDLLGLEVQSSTITVNVSAQEGNGKLLGNALTGLSTLINTDAVSRALNNVLSTTVNLLNSVDLQVSGVGSGVFSSAAASTTQVLQLFVAPVHLDLLGALVDTDPITLTVTAHAGDGLVLGNVLTALTDLFNPPLPSSLDLAFINTRLDQLIADLNAQLPGIPSAPIPSTTWQDGQILSLTVPSIDLNLLGLLLNTTPITVNATTATGDGLLLGNILTVVLNTLDATTEELRELSANLNEVLAKLVGVLNVSTLTLPPTALSSLSAVLQTLALPTLITSPAGATTPVLDLVIASPDGTSPPVTVDLLGVHVETSDINAQIAAQTGDGQILGNLVYNVANLLNPDTPSALVFLLAQLAR